MLEFFLNDNGEKIVKLNSKSIISKFPKKEAKRFISKKLKKKLD